MKRVTPLRAKRKHKSAEVKRFHDWVAEQGCLVSGEPATLHHVTGYADKPGRFSRSDWLVAPLAPRFHQKVFDPFASNPVSVEGLSHQGFYLKHKIDLLAEAMRLAEDWLRRAA
jgi:hypothetical protein